MKRILFKVGVFSLIMALIVPFALTGCKKAGVVKDETVKEVSSVKTNEPVKLKLLVQMPPEFIPEKNPLVEEIQKATNTILEYELTPINSFNERLNIVLASGTYPDIMQFASMGDKAYLNAQQNGVVIPVTNFVKDFPSLIKHVDPISYSAMKANNNGEVYGIPRNTVVRGDGFAVRKDWLKNVGLSIPADGFVTQAELKEILTRFTKNDPDKNGKNDTYGYTDSAVNGNLAPLFAQAFDVLGWQKHVGKYEYMSEMYCSEHDNFKNALEFTAGLWKEGLIDPNWPGNKGTAYQDRFASGAAGITKAFGGWLYMYDTKLKANFPEGEITYIYGVKNKNGEVKLPSTFGANVFGMLSLTTTAKGKEKAALSVCDYMLSDEGWNLLKFGVKGIHYNEKDGKKELTKDFDEYDKYRSYFTLLRRYDDPEYFVPTQAPENFKKLMNDTIDKCMKITVPSVEYGYVPAASKKPEYIDYMKTINQTISKIIVGDLPVSAWNKTIEGWYKAGGTDYVQQMNDYIKTLANVKK